MDRKELGELGERIACEYLVGKGYKILGKNYRINFGELDIIAKKDKVIHFVEVKTVAGLACHSFSPEERADWKKQRKLKRLAEMWLAKNKLAQDAPHQIDIAGIVVDEYSRMARLHYFSNVIAEN